MTSDEHLLREFRAEIPAPDEETRRKIYANAFSGTRRSAGWRTRAWAEHLRATPSVRLAAIVGAGALSAAVAAMAATGTFNDNAKHARTVGAGPPASTRHLRTVGGTEAPGDPMSVTYNRSGGTLSSINLTVNPSMPDASIELQVLHSSASTASDVNTANSEVVYQAQVSATNTSSTAAEPSSWSGTLSPSDWSGGCQSGLYQILAVSVGPGTSLANASSANSERDYSGAFSCSGS
jgi:hypothetical protein